MIFFKSQNFDLWFLLTKDLPKKRGGDLHVNLDRWLHKFNFSNSAHFWVQTVKHCHVPGIHHKWYKFVLPWHVLWWFCSTWVANWAYIGPRWGNGYCFVKANIKLGSSGWLWGLYTWLQLCNYREWTVLLWHWIHLNPFEMICSSIPWLHFWGSPALPPPWVTCQPPSGKLPP